MEGLLSTPKQPTIAQPAPLPDSNDIRIAEAKRRKAQAAAQSSGRESTMLTKTAGNQQAAPAKNTLG